MIDDCLAHGVTATSPWRDQIDAAGLAEAVHIVESEAINAGQAISEDDAWSAFEGV